MTNLEKLNSIFSEVFSVDVSMLGDGFDNNNVDEWDSIHQLSLTTAIEDEFDLLFDAEDLLEFTSYSNSKKILAKYNIDLSI